MNLDWGKLRTWKSSKNNAFEELCCQLAHTEPMPASAYFVRNAPPDSGAECYWKLANDEEWGWQAKFSANLSSSLWQQLDRSVQAAIKKRPKLTRYFVCLPFLLTGGETKQHSSGRDQWQKHELKWKAWAKASRRSLEFVLWDDHELWIRLSKEEHRGRRVFWFGETAFGSEWFRDQVDAAVEQAGDRYDAALNIEVPENELFPALARTSILWKRLNDWAINFRESLTKDLPHQNDKEFQGELADLRQALGNTVAAINNLHPNESAILDFAGVKVKLEQAGRALSEIEKKLWEVERKAIEKFREIHNRAPENYEQYRTGFSWHLLHNLQERIYKAKGFLDSDFGRLINLPALLVTGEAGSGKTHILCNSAKSLLKAGVPVILLLGEQFHGGEPWTQILAQLGLKNTREELLGALDAAAEAAQTRAVIIIDALNEGDGLRLWPHHLSSFLAQVRRWPRLSICFSIRSGYEAHVLPSILSTAALIRVTHRGFSNVELEAATRFFDYFGIATPSVPILSPEFANPLFLKLFCRALQNAGLKQVPTGLQGITATFDFFLDTINTKLAQPATLDFDTHSHIVQRAVNRIAELMVERGLPTLPVDLVQQELNQILPRSGYEHSLERRLHVEGVLARQLEFDPSTKQSFEVIRFTYQRFTDHRIVCYLLNATRKGNQSHIFDKDSAFWKLVDNTGWYWRAQGVWDALAIQLPELFGIELPEALRGLVTNDDIRKAFLSSLVWRKRDAFTAETSGWVVRYRDHSSETYAETMDTILTVSTCSNHPFCAEYIHDFLMSIKMPARDAQWSIFLFHQYGEGTSVDRLINWGMSETAHSTADLESVRLGSVALV